MHRAPRGSLRVRMEAGRLWRTIDLRKRILRDVGGLRETDQRSWFPSLSQEIVGESGTASRVHFVAPKAGAPLTPSPTLPEKLRWLRSEGKQQRGPFGRL